MSGRLELNAAYDYSSPKLPAALLRYRIMAYITGIGLVLLVLFAMPMKYFGDNDTFVSIIGVAHGWLYVLYVMTSLDLSFRIRWNIGRTAWVVLAGTIPFISFVAEHYVAKEVKRGIATNQDEGGPA